MTDNPIFHEIPDLSSLPMIHAALPSDGGERFDLPFNAQSMADLKKLIGQDNIMQYSMNEFCSLTGNTTQKIQCLHAYTLQKVHFTPAIFCKCSYLVTYNYPSLCINS